MVKVNRFGYWLFVCVCVIIVGFFANFVYAEEKEGKLLKIVATTSLIGSIVQEVGADKVEVVTIIPSGMCPGHFDIRPEQVKVLEEARAILEQGIEGELFVEDILELIENEDLLRTTLGIEGNWMIPEVHIQAVDEITQILCQVEPEYADLFESRALDYKEEISIFSRQIKQEAQELRVSEVKVVCSRMQVEFADWLGFEIVATYGRPEDFTPRELKEIIKKAKEADAELVIDNLQSGPKAGIPIADEIKGEHLVLTNFPQDFKGRLSYPKSLKENASKLFRAIKE